MFFFSNYSGLSCSKKVYLRHVVSTLKLENVSFVKHIDLQAETSHTYNKNVHIRSTQVSFPNVCFHFLKALKHSSFFVSFLEHYCYYTCWRMQNFPLDILIVTKVVELFTMHGSFLQSWKDVNGRCLSFP